MFADRPEFTRLMDATMRVRKKMRLLGYNPPALASGYPMRRWLNKTLGVHILDGDPISVMLTFEDIIDQRLEACS